MILRLTSSTLALMMATAPAAFALNADEVWTAWETYLGGSGYEVAVGSRDGGGDALTLKDVVLTMADEAAGTTTTITLPTIAMSQTGGGDVRTEYPDVNSFAFVGKTVDAGETVDMVFEGTIDLSSLETISREEGGRQVDTSKGPEATIAVTRIDVDGEGPEGTPVSLVMRDLDTTSTFLGGLNVVSEGRIGGMTGTIDMTAPEGDASFKGEFTLGAAEFSSETDIPEGHDAGTASALAEALRAGAAMTGKGSVESLGLDLDVTAPDGDAAFAMQSGAMSFDFALADGSLRYQADLSDLDYGLVGATLPFPVQVALNAVSMDIQFPLLGSDDPQPFKLAYSLDGLTLNDAIWGMIDQAGALPHDPADLDLDLTGEILVREDLLTLAEQAGADDMGMGMTESPINPVSFTLNQLALSAVGAGASAEGTLRFPDPENVQIAVGTLNAEFKGINGLMDKLVDAGFIGANDVQGMRMMLMMIAKPVEGQDDTLQTELEMKEDGSVFANGMQLK